MALFYSCRKQYAADGHTACIRQVVTPPPPAAGNQITYEAKVTVPAWATCLMSALESAQPQAAGAGKRTFSWKQSVPMPSYLIAIAVGELESREISPR